MAVTYSIATTVRTNNGSITIPSVSVSGDAELVYDDTIAAGATNKQIVLAVDVSEVKCIVIAVDGLTTGKTILIETNNSGTPVDTITLTADVKGVVWYTGSTADNPLTTDVTAFYVTSDDTVARRLRIYVCADVTP
jgi:hypothetical protein